MDNPTTLLVAIMYVTIVATGLISTLMALSDVIVGHRKLARIHALWVVLLLLNYFSFFWSTTALLDIEGWNFRSFLAFIVGPVVLLFATNLILAVTDGGDEVTLEDRYLDLSGRFFGLLVIVQLWIIGLDIVFGPLNASTFVTAGMGVVFAVLALSRDLRWHGVGAAVAVLGFLSRLLLQST
jgi:hypothetical protein